MAKFKVTFEKEIDVEDFEPVEGEAPEQTFKDQILEGEYDLSDDLDDNTVTVTPVA